MPRSAPAPTEKLAEIKAAYDEFGGSAAYWEALEKEVDEVVAAAIRRRGARDERAGANHFDIWRGGDLGARFVFALIGLIIGSIIIALPFIPIFEDMFAFALTAVGFLYPDLKRFMIERRYMKVLNRLVTDSARYQENGRLHYMTSQDIQKAFEPGNPTTAAAVILERWRLAGWPGGVRAAEWEACAGAVLPAKVEGLAVRRRDAAGPAGEDASAPSRYSSANSSCFSTVSSGNLSRSHRRSTIG